MPKFPIPRNFGFGKQIAWAGHQALRSYYGQGHFATAQAHFLRWRHFCDWLRAYYGIRDASMIKAHHLADYAEHLAQQVEEEVMAVAYAQNLLSSVNTTLKALRERDERGEIDVREGTKGGRGKELGLELAQELGHNRLDVLAAYIGSHRR